MSRLEELIQHLCPEGVEWKILEEVCDIIGGRDYKHLLEGDIPVYGTGGYMLSVSEALSYNQDAIGIGRKGQRPEKHLDNENRYEKAQVLPIVIAYAFICPFEMNAYVILDLLHGLSFLIFKSKKEEV